MPDHQRRVYDSILDLLPCEENPTPLVRINRVSPFEHTRVYAKLEWYNPFGAVKDRVAANLIRDAESRGVLDDGQRLVEPTSGNTGMGLAMIANARGYKLTTPLSTAIPQEKRTMLRFFGAEVMELEDSLCPAPGAPEGAIAKALDLAARPEFQMLNQYANPANPGAHYRTTGPEIWRQTDGGITHFVAGLGTCGTITGTGRFLKEKGDRISVLGVHPREGHDIPGVRSIRQLEQTELFAPDEYDGLIEVSNRDAFDLCLRLNREESLIAGPSSGMALAGAFRIVPDEPGNLVVVIFPDSAFKYASSVTKHLPEVAAGSSGSPSERMLAELIENVRHNEDLTISADAAAREMGRGDRPVVLDVRAYERFVDGHLPGAVSVPLGEMREFVSTLPDDRRAMLLTVCERGNASLSGLLFLKSLGYENVRSITGGTMAWKALGLDVVSGP
ncbi:MAG: pyridoxal-phosphate dependent enzyme [Nannocystaceae bacterium]